jgi:phosphatidylglycerol:prolipoprotein diacylglycerol transferase
MYTVAAALASNNDLPWIGFPKIELLKKMHIKPVLIENLFGTGISIHWYGVIIAVAIMVALTLAMRQSKKFGIKEDDIIDMFLVALPVSIVFSRLFFVVFSWKIYKYDLLGIFRVWEGGLSIYGAIIGAILSVFVFSRIKKIDMLNLCDFACVYLPLSQAIGRWGNFVNQELYGSVTNLPWGMTGSRIGLDPVHPTFLYESLLNIIVFVILLRLRKNKKVKGTVLASYLISYSLVRFLMEFLRTDEFGTGNIRYNQVFSVLVFIGAFVWMLSLTRRAREAKIEEEAAEEPSAYAEVVEKLRAEETEARDEDPAENVDGPDDEDIRNDDGSGEDAGNNIENLVDEGGRDTAESDVTSDEHTVHPNDEI